jgi:hypothetical protein
LKSKLPSLDQQIVNQDFEFGSIKQTKRQIVQQVKKVMYRKEYSRGYLINMLKK